MAEQTRRCSIDNNNIFCFDNDARHVRCKIWCYQLTKTTQDDSRKSYKISNLRFSKEHSREFQILAENPQQIAKFKKIVCIWICDMKDIIWIWK